MEVRRKGVRILVDVSQVGLLTELGTRQSNTGPSRIDMNPDVRSSSYSPSVNLNGLDENAANQ